MTESDMIARLSEYHSVFIDSLFDDNGDPLPERRVTLKGDFDGELGVREFRAANLRTALESALKRIECK